MECFIHKGMIHVCPLNAVEGIIAEHSPSHVVSLLSEELMNKAPDGIEPGNHLRLSLNDIAVEQEGLTAPGREHVEKLIGFFHEWPGEAPMLVHCWAGISRSTAAAFIALCMFNPEHDEQKLAETLRSASPEASPNPLLIAFADDVLERRGRMIGAIAGIGRGAMAFEGAAFSLPARMEG